MGTSDSGAPAIASPFHPNQCPRCGFTYSRWVQRRRPFTERWAVVQRHGPTAFGHARAAMEMEVTPWQCRCGAVLRKRPTRYGAIDILAIVVIAGNWVVLCGHYAWARSFWIPGLAIGAWVTYRSYAQFSLEELQDQHVPDPIQ